MNAVVKILAINDEQTTCDCCGKTNLKRTVVLELANGSVVCYGTDCAAKAFKGMKSTFKSNADVLAYVQAWLNKTPAYTAEIVAKGIWNKFGYLTKTEGGTIYIHNDNQWTRIG